jgi:hypothetical protein
VRTLFASALVLFACGCADRSSRPSGADATPSIPSGPDAVVLRIPRAGGAIVAHAYPSLDSVVWKSANRAPPIGRLIAFGPEDGYLAGIDSSGAPIRIDLRLGTVQRMRVSGLTAVASHDGAAIYALNGAGELTRFTPSGGDWKVRFPPAASALLPQADGSLIVAGAQDDRVLVWRVRPPNDSVSDSVSVEVGASGDLPGTVAATSGTVGDRVYIGGHQRVIAVTPRDLRVVLGVDIGQPVTSLAFTPSGDRVYVSVRGEPLLRIVDRFAEGVSGRVRLPGEARDLRMDPLGRVVLVRGPADTTWVVSVAEGRVQGSVVGAWRPDLPLVLVDGRIAVARGENVVLLHGTSLEEAQVVEGGASDYWYALRWNGFRPRAAGLDSPVEFRMEPRRIDSTMVDSAGDTLVGPPSAPPATTPRRPSAAAPTRFTVSFAAVLNERQARDLARQIRVDGVSPRVTTSDREGRTIYRVILGPFASRAEAERVGRASGHNYWVYEGEP